VPAALRRVTATRYVTPLREGGSLPGLVEADDDGLYVAKFRGAGQGAAALVAEVLAGELVRALGLPVPELVVAQLDPDLPRAEPDQEIQDLLTASAGTNLGVDFLPGALPFTPAAWSPAGSHLVFAAPESAGSGAVPRPSKPKTTLALFTPDDASAAPPTPLSPMDPAAPASAPVPSHGSDPAAGHRLAGLAGQSPAWRGDGCVVALARPGNKGPLLVQAVDPSGRRAGTVALPQVPAKPLPACAVRWDAAHAQAIVAARESSVSGTGQVPHWLVRFRDGAEHAGLPERLA